MVGWSELSSNRGSTVTDSGASDGYRYHRGHESRVTTGAMMIRGRGEVVCVPLPRMVLRIRPPYRVGWWMNRLPKQRKQRTCFVATNLTGSSERLGGRVKHGYDDDLMSPPLTTVLHVGDPSDSTGLF